MDAAELRSIVRAVRWFALALAFGGLFPIAFVVALIAFSRVMRTVDDPTVRRHVGGITVLWVMFAGAALLGAGDSGSNAPDVLWWLTAGTLPLASMWSLVTLAGRTDPPRGVRRWGAIGHVSATVLFGVAAAVAGAHAVTEQPEWGATAQVVLTSVVVTAAVIGLMVGYGSTIGHLERLAEAGDTHIVASPSPSRT